MDVAVLQPGADLLGDHDGAVLLRFAGRGADVRQGDHPRMVLQEIARKVTHIGVEGPRIQGRHGRRVVDDAVARKVQQDPAGPHMFEALGVDHAPGRVRQGDMKADEVGAQDQIVHARGLFHIGFELPGPLHRDGRVVADHLHAEGAGGVGDLDADGPETDDAQGAPRKLEAHELLLAALHGLMDGGVVPRKAARKAPGLGDVAGRQEHAGDDQFLDRVSVGAGGVEHGYTALGHVGDGDVVDAGAGATHGLDRLRDLPVVHVGGTHQYRIRTRDLGGHLVLVPRQAVEAGNGDVIQREYLEH